MAVFLMFGQISVYRNINNDRDSSISELVFVFNNEKCCWLGVNYCAQVLVFTC